jgi:steroid delta-isomerase-like uncharacterized protein
MWIFRTVILLLAIAGGTVFADQEQANANKRLAIQIMDIFNSHNLEPLDQLIDADYVDHAGLNGKEEYIHAVESFVKGFPNLHVTIEDCFAESDKVALRSTFDGTHKGVFLGIQPTGRSVKWSGIAIFRFEKGKLVERWNTSDTLSIYKQLGYKLDPPRRF